MNHDEHSILPPFPHSFLVVGDPDGQKSFLQILENRTVKAIHDDLVIDAILCYCANQLAKHPSFRFDHGQAKKCMLFWKSVTPPAPRPAQLLELSEEGLCYRRLPFDSVADSNRCPVFCEFLSRIDNADALQIFIGSWFFPDSDRHQYVWIWGQGGDGKSSILRFADRVLGDQYHAEDATSAKSQFWLSSFVNKRLVAFPDCNNYALPMSGLFKSITGNDRVRLERKNKDATSGVLNCKVMVMSNQPPKLSAQRADMRRAIICEIQPIRGEERTDYDDLIWEEAPFIIGCCKARYLEACKDGKKIPVNTHAAEMLAYEAEEVYEQAFTEHFARCGISHDDKRFAVPAYVVKNRIEISGLKTGQEQRDFYLYMGRRYGVRYKRSASGGYYYGIRLLDATEQRESRKNYIDLEEDAKPGNVHRM